MNIFGKGVPIIFHSLDMDKTYIYTDLLTKQNIVWLTLLLGSKVLVNLMVQLYVKNIF